MKVNLKIGDTILTGKFKNKKVEVKEFDTDDNGQPTVNGRPMLNFRIEKLMPKKKSKKEGTNGDNKMKITESRLKSMIQSVINEGGDETITFLSDLEQTTDLGNVDEYNRDKKRLLQVWNKLKNSMDNVFGDYGDLKKNDADAIGHAKQLVDILQDL